MPERKPKKLPVFLKADEPELLRGEGPPEVEDLGVRPIFHDRRPTHSRGGVLGLGGGLLLFWSHSGTFTRPSAAYSLSTRTTR